MCERLTITIQCYQLISIPFIMHHRHGCVLKVLHWVSSSQSWEDELTIMMYVHVHYIICTAVDKASSPPSSCRSFAPQTQVSPYKPFPGLSDNDLTPTLLVSSLMTLKINPLQSCPAHVIVVKMIDQGMWKCKRRGCSSAEILDFYVELGALVFWNCVITEHKLIGSQGPLQNKAANNKSAMLRLLVIMTENTFILIT